VQNGIKALNFTGESSVKTKCHREESIFSWIERSRGELPG
jgi:hypothetical protein